MVVKTNKGWVVKSEKGKTLSRPYPLKTMAQQRLNQIDFKGKKK